jgi:hypothetical protein
MMDQDVPHHHVIPDKQGQDDENISTNEQSPPLEYYSTHTNPAWIYYWRRFS